MDMQAKTLLLRAYHRGSLAEVDDDNREAAARLVGLRYAGNWRTLLGREAIRLSERGRLEALRLERSGR